LSYRDRALHSVSCQTFCIIPLHSWCLYISDTFPIYIIVSLRQLTFAVDILWVLWVSIHLSAIVMPTARHTGCKGKRHHCFPFPGQGFCCLYPVSCLFVVHCHVWVCLCFFLFLVFNMSRKSLLQWQAAGQLLLAFGQAMSEFVFQFKWEEKIYARKLSFYEVLPDLIKSPS